MNLTKLFNKDYFFQNIKKSKGLFILLFIILPVFTTLMLFSLSNNGAYVVADLETISSINIFCLFFLPTILSLALFSYVFKKKSVDFINSMPISKKTIFLTNTIGGIGIILATLLITLLMIFIVGITGTKIILFNGVFLDFIIYWFIAYMFVFIATNLAISVSGNAITSIAVTLLLLFFVPFLMNYTTSFINNSNSTETKLMIKCEDKSCIPDYYNCYDNKECKVNKDLHTYQTSFTTSNNLSYTIPYELISKYFFNASSSNQIYNVISILKTLLITIVYFVIGLFAFINRKMEVCETSFKNFNTHLFVKGLTLMPIVLILYYMIDYSLVGLLMFLALIITYYFVFDLITRKSIVYFRKSLIFLAITLLIWLGYAYVVNDTDLLRKESKTIRLSSSDVTSVKLSSSSYNELGLDNNYYSNRELINLVLNYSYSSQYRIENSSEYTPLNFIIKLKNGKKYTITESIPNSKYNDFINKLASVSKVDDSIRKFSFANNDVVYFNNEYIIDEKLIYLLKNSAKKITSKEYYKNFDGDENFGSLYVYVYKNHQLLKYNMSGLVNSSITEYMANRSNNDLQNTLSIKFNNDQFYINIVRFDSILYNNDTYSHYFIDNMSKELYDFACKYGTEDFDSTKPYAVISYQYLGDSINYLYTNEVDELEKVYKEKRNSLIDTEEYKKYVANNSSSTEKN